MELLNSLFAKKIDSCIAGLIRFRKNIVFRVLISRLDASMRLILPL